MRLDASSRGEKRAALAALRRRIQVLEGGAQAGFEEDKGAGRSQTKEALAGWRLGVAAVDQALPAAGLAPAGVYDVVPDAQDDMAAVHGFALALLAQHPLQRMQNANAPLLICQSQALASEFGRVFGAGLAPFGFTLHDVLTATAPRDGDTLWAMEEAARSGAVGAVIGTVAAVSFKQTQRLNRAGLAGGVPVFLMRMPAAQTSGAVLTRWRVNRISGRCRALDQAAPGVVAWRVVLDRCRGGRRGTWGLEWSHETHRFALVSQLRARPAEASGAQGVARARAEVC